MGAGLAIVMLIAGAEEPPPADAPPPAADSRWQPARGSTAGPWGYCDLGFVTGAQTFVNPGLYATAALDSALVGGWGFERGGVRVVPSAAFAWGYSLLGSATAGSRFSWSPVALAVSVPFEETWVTRIRVMPVFSVTVPTSTELTFVPLSTLSLGLRLARRFGPVEAAYRIEGARNIFGPRSTSPGVVAPPLEAWILLHRFFVEGWIAPWFSAAIGFALRTSWLPPTPVPADPFSPQPPPSTVVRRRDLFDSTVQLNFTVYRWVGVTLSMDTLTPTLTADGRSVVFPFFQGQYTSFALRVWVRSDELLQRNWLDR